MAARPWLLASPILLVMLATVAIPILDSLRLTVVPSGFAAGEQTPTLAAYASFFSRDRGGVIVSCLLQAATAGAWIGFLLLPPIGFIAAAGRSRLLLAIEFALLLPFFFSPALRLHSLKALLLPHGWLGEAFTLIGVHSVSPASILFSNAGVRLGLAFSFGGFLLLPVVQYVRRTPESLRRAMLDVGMSTGRAALLYLRLGSGALWVGATLFVCVAWFSSLEYQILGRSRSVLDLMDGLIAVKKYTECYAYGAITWFLTVGMLVVIVLTLRPEKLLEVTGGSDID